TSKGSKRVVAVRGSKNVWHQDVAVNFHLTLVACGSAAGFMVPPLFVLPGSTVKLQVLGGCDVPGFAVTTSSSCFMNGFLFIEWLRFFSDSVPSDVQRPLLLIMDGCSSHYSVEIILEAARLDVLLLLLPSNATHLLQPLDVAVFSSFKAKLRRLTEIYVGKTGGNSVDKAEAIKMASTAWVGCKMGENVKAGFAGYVVQKEVLVLPLSKKRTRKTVTVAGRLLTKEALDAIAGPTKKPRKSAKSKKVSTKPKLPKAKKQKQVKMLGPVTQQALPAAKPVGIMQRIDVVWEAIV
ncbi:hypothetical protein PR001_g31333, partial [Phytophthora rubi]